MKNILFKSILILVIGGLTVSCDDELDQIPFDSFGTENAFVTAADFENGIRGAYSGLTRAGYFGSSDAGSLLSAPDILSDNVTLAQAGRNTKRNLHEWTYNASAGFRGLYQDTYTVIYRANLVLQYIESFEGESKNNITGEALALRAMAHFDNVKTFAKIPTQSGDANSSLGIVYRTTPDPIAQDPRESVGAVYDKIVDDLETALTLINASNPDGRLNKKAVATLLSRVYLYMGRWQDAIDAANFVSESDVASRDSFLGLWIDENQDGLLFYIPNATDGINANIGVTWNQGSLANLIPEFVASYELDQLYDEGNDIRKEAYIVDAVTNQDDNVNAIKKLLGRGTQTNGLVDYKIFRGAEAFLNKAEAYNQLGNTTAARQALDVVRTRRYNTPPSGETGVALTNAIKLERRLEFAFEYQRFYDIKRYGESVTRENFGDLEGGLGTPSNDLVLPAGNFKFQLPIDQSTLIVNPSLQQNPGY